LFGILAFNRFGRTLHRAYQEEARHVAGHGTPGAADLLGALGGLTDPNGVCDLVTGVCIGGCFVAGTPVAVAAGERSIDAIVPGERVWARDPETGAIALRPVTKTWIRRHTPVITLALRTGDFTTERLKVTDSHRFWVEGSGWTPAGQLASTSLWSADTSVFASVLASEPPEVTTVYHLEVEGFHTDFVGHSRALVHNQTGNPGAPNNCQGNPPNPGVAPVMPPGLSQADQELWKECNQQHNTYKNTQDQVASHATTWDPIEQRLQNNSATPQERFDYCFALDERITLAERLHRERMRYINRGCDKFDWFSQGKTQAEREQQHRMEAQNVSNQIRNLRGRKQRLCSQVP
jgi:hypothetical protein